MNLTKKQIELIIENTPEELKGYYESIKTILGSFRPAGANWCWVAGWTCEGQLVVTRFGEIM